MFHLADVHRMYENSTSLKYFNDKMMELFEELDIPVTKPNVDNFMKNLSKVDLKTHKFDRSKVKLRKCQSDCLKIMEEYIDEGGNLKLATGSGKSVIISHFIMNHPNERFLILVPKRAILRQFADLFNEFKIDYTLCGDQEKPDPKKRVCLSVYNSVGRVTDCESIIRKGTTKLKCKSSYDFVIVDEAHHVYVPFIYAGEINESGETYLDIIRNLSGVHFNFSGTIDDPIFEYNVEEAINDNVLVDFNIEINHYEEINKAALVDVLHKHPECMHVIVFCSKISESDKLAEYLNKHDISAGSINADVEHLDRDKIFKGFLESEIRVITNVNVLAEGVDLPITDTVIFYAEKSSKISVIQSVGRALRLSPGKKISHVIIMVERDTYKQILNRYIRILSSEFNFMTRMDRLKMGNSKDNPGDDPKDEKEIKLIGKDIFEYCSKLLASARPTKNDIIETLEEYRNTHLAPPNTLTKYHGIEIGAILRLAITNERHWSREIFIKLWGEKILTRKIYY